MSAHKSVTKKRIAERYEETQGTLDNPGICMGCGEDVEGVEPDARKYTCECCGADRVYGVEELFMMHCF